MKRRTHNKGFTLIELMVVILILGLLATVIGLAVTNVIAGNKAKLDATALSDFAGKLSVSLNDPERIKAANNKLGSGQGTAAKLFCELKKFNVITFDEIKKLAGASGAAGDEAAYSGENPDTTTNIIFTGPDSFRELRTLFTSGAKKGEEKKVSLCYNKNFVNTYPEHGCVILLAGEQKASVLTLEAARIDFNNGTINYEDPTGTMYGKGAFEKIKPE